MSQQRDKVVYTINIMPFNFSDTWGLLWRA
jgi:hypothetical protein